MNTPKPAAAKSPYRTPEQQHSRTCDGYANLNSCTGTFDCPAGQHLHGCHADFGSCDNPAEHWNVS